MSRSTMFAEPADSSYARGFLLCAIVSPLFSTGVALSFGRAPGPRVLVCFCRSAASAPATRIWRENFTGKPAIMEHGTDRCVVTDFLRDGKITERSCHSPQKIAEPEHRSGNRIGRHLGAVLQEHQFLVAHTNDDAIQIVR